MNIESNRLILETLSLEDLIHFSNKLYMDKKDTDLTEFTISETQKRAINIKIDKMRKADKSIHAWYTYWLIINKSDFKAMGLVGFKGLDEEGIAEIGYGISKQYEGNGYMTEAVKTLIQWAFHNKSCNTITAPNVLRTNIGSQKVLLKSGFKKVDESEDTFSYELEK